MSYKHAFDKLLKAQDEFKLATDVMAKEGILPEDLSRALEGVQKWEELVMWQGFDTPIDVDALDALSNALYMYQGMFSGHEQNAVVEWREYAHELYNLALQPA